MTDAAEQIGVPIGGVRPDQVMLVWDKIEPVLARAVHPETGDTLDSIRMDLMMAKMQLWVIGDFQGVVVTTIIDRPTHRVLYTPYLAGENMKEWLDDWIDVQDEYAQHNKCAAVEFSGRRGWLKALAHKPEFKPVRTIFRREF